LFKVSKDEDIKDKIIEKYLEDYKSYENKFFTMIKSQIFTKSEQEEIEKKLEQTPLKIFQKTY
jgi:hypothetical protein